MNRSFIIMGIFVCLILGSSFLAGKSFLEIFMHNYWLNSVIVGTFLFGVAYCFYQVFTLKLEYNWLDSLKGGKENKTPKILAPIHLAITNNAMGGLNLVSMKSLLSSVDQRLDEKREINRYLVGLCVFLGLVGTFFGLSKTIGAIAHVIGGIDIDATDIKDAFQNLKTGLQAPLSGMGYAFSSSLFGLLASLTLSFLDIQVAKAFTKFYQKVEETLSLHLQQSGRNNNAASGPAYGEALVEQLAEAMNGFAVQLDRSEESRIQMAKITHNFFATLNQLSDILKSNVSHIDQLTHQHFELQQQLARLIHVYSDETSRKSLKSIEVSTQNILDELGKSKGIDELRQEIRMVSKTFSALAANQ